MKKYAKRMTLEDRKTIERNYREGVSVADIAKLLDRNLAGVYRELNRGITGKFDKNGNPEYSAAIAEKQATKARSNKGRPRKATLIIRSSN